MLTEFGGIAYLKCPIAGVYNSWGYSSVDSDEAFLAL